MTGDGQAIGSFCALDFGPREWSAADVALLRDLAASAMTEIELRAAVAESKRQAEAAARAEAELREANTLLHRTREQAVRQERLRALGTMASGIAHDLNNALAPVVGYSELLLLGQDVGKDTGRDVGQNLPDGRSQVREYLELIRTGAQDAAGVVERLREFYRQREEGEALQPVDLPALARQTVALTRPRWRDQAQVSGRTIQLCVETDAAPPVLGREAELRELLTNLIFNAADALPGGGTITVGVRTEDGGRKTEEDSAPPSTVRRGAGAGAGAGAVGGGGRWRGDAGGGAAALPGAVLLHQGE